MLSFDLNDLWEKALSILKKQVSKPSYQTWIKPIRPIRFENGMIEMQVPNEFAKDWLENRYYDLIKEVLEEVTHQEVGLTFVLPDPGEPLSDSDNVLPLDSFLNSPDIFPICHNPKYTFDTFVVADSNRFAHAAAFEAAESPAGSYNPLFIHGGVGLGKTHLIQAVGHHAFQNNSKVKVAYLSSEKFTYELINSIRDDKIANFRNKYRSVDLLLVDDIQFLAGKERTQEEFFYTFNALYQANKQIIISSSQHPKLIPVLEETLRSRFEGGLIIDIQPPDLETRIAILTKKARAENLKIPREVITYISSQFHSNIRELEGALTRVVLYSLVKKTKVNLELTVDALKDILN